MTALHILHVEDDKDIRDVTAFALTLVAAPQASDPSFNCNRASTPSEHAICAEPRLGRLDRRLADRYVAVRRAMSPAQREAFTPAKVACGWSLCAVSSQFRALASA